MLSRGEVVRLLVERVRRTLPDAREHDLTEDRDLRDFAGFDSLAVLEILAWLESRFQVSVLDADESIGNFCSIGKMADHVVGRHAGGR